MTETIRLGGRDFTLRPPTLGQLRHLLDALDAMTGASGGALIDAAALDLDASLAELNIAVAAILQSAWPCLRDNRSFLCEALRPLRLCVEM